MIRRRPSGRLYSVCLTGLGVILTGGTLGTTLPLRTSAPRAAAGGGLGGTFEGSFGGTSGASAPFATLGAVFGISVVVVFRALATLGTALAASALILGALIAFSTALAVSVLFALGILGTAFAGSVVFAVGAFPLPHCFAAAASSINCAGLSATVAWNMMLCQLQMMTTIENLDTYPHIPNLSSRSIESYSESGSDNNLPHAKITVAALLKLFHFCIWDFFAQFFDFKLERRHRSIQRAAEERVTIWAPVRQITVSNLNEPFSFVYLSHHLPVYYHYFYFYVHLHLHFTIRTSNLKLLCSILLQHIWNKQEQRITRSTIWTLKFQNSRIHIF
jgi:hypothetical protein